MLLILGFAEANKFNKVYFAIILLYFVKGALSRAKLQKFNSQSTIGRNDLIPSYTNMAGWSGRARVSECRSYLFQRNTALFGVVFGAKIVRMLN